MLSQTLAPVSYIHLNMASKLKFKANNVAFAKSLKSIQSDGILSPDALRWLVSLRAYHQKFRL